MQIDGEASRSSSSDAGAERRVVSVLCLNDMTNSSVYVAGRELAYRYTLLPGQRYLLLPHYVRDQDAAISSHDASSSSSSSSRLQFCIRLFAAVDLTCR